MPTGTDPAASMRAGMRAGDLQGRDLGNQVAERLAKDTICGVYQPGDFLPKETELCTLFGVSRASVRSGLQSLVAMGIVRRHTGQGTVVQEHHNWNILDPVLSRWMADYATPHPEVLREIFEFRLAIEPYIAALAAERADARDLVAIEDGFAGMERSLAAANLDRAVFSDHDVAFHAAIYRATHNLIWSQLAHLLRPSILMVVRITVDTADELRDSLGRHRDLMEAIRLRRPQAAYDAAIRVMGRTARDLGLHDLQGVSSTSLPWKDAAAQAEHAIGGVLSEGAGMPRSSRNDRTNG